ncbi:MAG: protein-ADP-ribose hydrolase [Firmicutes bacterium]|nr:protein-ADP-ribose hydrolase [Bacillota bacterium]
MNPIDQEARLNYLIDILINEQALYQKTDIPDDYPSRRQLLRALMNIRKPAPLAADFLQVQDEFLSQEAQEKGIVTAEDIPYAPQYPRISLWRGDITTLKVDAIANAANASLLGCFIPCHDCIDNAIHSAAGLQLREECHQLITEQGHLEFTGQAKITKGYNLPASYIIHTVGPVIETTPSVREAGLLASCYSSCLQIAQEMQLATIAFCCISTGIFNFPQYKAAQIAFHTVNDFLASVAYPQRVIFNVFTQNDERIYRQLLMPNCY